MDAVWTGITLTALIGAAGTIIGILGQCRAKQANYLAAQANRDAHTALTHAEQANRIAERANKLSEDANTIIRRQAEQAGEDWLVEWAIEWNADAAVVEIVNTGRDTAHEVTVVVNGRVLNDLRDGFPPAPRGTKITVPLPEVRSLRAEHAKSDIIGHWSAEIHVIVLWHTSLGQPRQQRVNLQIS